MRTGFWPEGFEPDGSDNDTFNTMLNFNCLYLSAISGEYY